MVKELKLWMYSILVCFWVLFHDIQMHSIMWKSDCPSQKKYIYILLFNQSPTRTHCYCFRHQSELNKESDSYQEYLIIFQPENQKKKYNKFDILAYWPINLSVISPITIKQLFALKFSFERNLILITEIVIIQPYCTQYILFSTNTFNCPLFQLH